MRPGETPEQARARAGRLRTSADRARTLADALGTQVDTAVTRASAPGVWQGPFAERVAGELRGHQSTLVGMAQGLQASANRWAQEADALEQEAAAVPAGGGR